MVRSILGREIVGGRKVHRTIEGLFIVLLVGACTQSAQPASQVLTAELSGRPRPSTFSFDPTPVQDGPSGTFTFTAEFCNIGHKRLSLLRSVTSAIEGGNVLLNRDPSSPPGVVSEL